LTPRTAGAMEMGSQRQTQLTQWRHVRGALALVALALAAALLATLATTPPAEAQGRQFYGVASQGSLAGDDYNRMRRGGVGTLRFMVSWRNVEPSPGDYRWGGTDAVIGEAASRGIRALPFVAAPPSHVRTPPTRPADRRAFRRLMSALANRYGRGGAYWRGAYQRQHGSGATPRPVRTWQFFNEQNGRVFWGGKPWPRAYGRLVKMGTRGVRSKNPRAEIILGGMFATPSGSGSITSWRYLRRLYHVKGIRRFFNTVALHPYSPNLRGIRIQMRRVRKVMRRNNDARKRIRVTEIGWGSARGAHALRKGPKGQARMLRRSFRLLTRHRNRRQGWNVGGINWFSWQDGSGCPFCDSSGLFSGPAGDREPKRSWRAFRRVAR
jgi:hypothetical protein